MLVELAVRDLGVIAETRLVFDGGMTVLSGETGAGKTLIVEAIELLLGGRADPVLVRPGAEEASVEGRFLVESADGRGDGAGPDGAGPDGAGPDGAGPDRAGPREIVLRRVVPRSGRSRAYVDGHLATAGMLAEVGASLVDLHGQHAHQSLLATTEQRASLDRFGRIDLAPYESARTRVRELEQSLAGLGGDERARAREIDRLRYQLDELTAAGIDDPDEDERLRDEEDLLAGAQAHREAAGRAAEALSADGAALDSAGTAVAALTNRVPFRDLVERLRAVTAELGDIAADLRTAAERIDDDPARLARIRERRHLLRELRRKYGDTLGDVLAHRDATRARLEELCAHDERAAEISRRLAVAKEELVVRARELRAARVAAAGPMAEAVSAHLHELAMPRARFEVTVGPRAGDEVTVGPRAGDEVTVGPWAGDEVTVGPWAGDEVSGPDPGDEIVFLLGANPGEPALPLAKVASGGELARAMLAVRLVTTHAPPTLVFDEVDAGIGGQAALAVGRALAALGATHQILVVTHLAQVAAHGVHHWVVTKDEVDGRTVSSARRLEPSERVDEIARMLSGLATSSTGRRHARELLTSARAAAS